MVDLKHLMIEAANSADQMLREHMQQQHQYHAKGERDYALATDIEIERKVKTILQQSGIPVLGEELAWQGDEQSSEFWVVDPIDGTINYAKGIPLCGICIALVKNQRAILSCISLPFLNERYIAETGKGSTLNGNTIATSSVQKLNDAIIALGDFAVGENSAVKNRLRFALVETLAPNALRIRMLGSAAVQLAWLAAGRVDASIILSNNAWDVQAGVLIAQEAGALAYDIDGEQHSVNSQYTLASPPSLKSEIIGAVKSARGKTDNQ